MWAHYTDKELNPSELAAELLSSISGSWRAELGNRACSDPFEIVAFSTRRDMEPERCTCRHVLMGIYEYAACLLVSAVLLAARVLSGVGIWLFLELEVVVGDQVTPHLHKAL